MGKLPRIHLRRYKTGEGLYLNHVDRLFEIPGKYADGFDVLIELTLEQARALVTELQDTIGQAERAWNTDDRSAFPYPFQLIGGPRGGQTIRVWPPPHQIRFYLDGTPSIYSLITASHATYYWFDPQGQELPIPPT